MSALGVSVIYAVAIRAGRCRPHPRHWLALAELVGVSANACQPAISSSVWENSSLRILNSAREEATARKSKQ
jgi:hypothetical protein